MIINIVGDNIVVDISADWVFLTLRFNLYVLKNILRYLEHLIGVRLVVKTQLMVIISLQWKKGIKIFGTVRKRQDF